MKNTKPGSAITSKNPLNSPGAAELNVTLNTGEVACGAKSTRTLGVIDISAVTCPNDKFTGAVPVFVTVNVCGTGVPGATEPNSRKSGFRVMLGAVTTPSP